MKAVILLISLYAQCSNAFTNTISPSFTIAPSRVTPFSNALQMAKEPSILEKIQDKVEINGAAVAITDSADDEVCEVKELSDTEKLLKQVKEAGTAGVISYALWELGFWALSVPVCISAYYGVTGHFPDFSNKDDMAKLGGEAFAFVNFARFAVPLRIGLALGTTPWIQANVVDKFLKKNEEEECVIVEDTAE